MSEIIQGSEAWFALRLGRATGSNFDAVLSKGKAGAEAVGRRNYRIRLALERKTGKVLEHGFKSQAMQDGNEREPFARMGYEARTGNFVKEVSFVPHKFLQAGVSPDGMVNDDGLVEIKCPTQAVHWEYLQLNDCPSEYKAQVQGQLWVTGRQWCDFVSYNPDFPEELQLHVVRVLRDEPYIKNLEAEVSRFLAEVTVTIKEIEALAAERKEA